MSIFSSGSASRFLGCFSAATLISASAAQSALHGYALGARSSEVSALIFSSASLAGAIMGPLALAAGFQACRAWALLRGALCLLLALACFAYAFVSSLGFVASARDAAAASRGAEATNYELARAKAEAATRELAAMAAMPPGNKRTEKERADRRATLEKSRADAEAVLSAGSKATSADPVAEALAVYGAVLGYEGLKAERVSPWLSLFSVAFFELAASLSLVVCGALQPPSTRRQEVDEAPAEAPAVAEPVAAPQIEAPEALADEPKRPGRKRGTALEVVKDRIAASGGRIEGSLEEISERLGLTKSSAHRALHSLAAAGVVALSTSQLGTVVSLR